MPVEPADGDDESRDMDAWYRELQAMVAQNDPSDWARVEQSLQAADEQAKALVCKQTDLP